MAAIARSDPLFDVVVHDLVSAGPSNGQSRVSEGLLNNLIEAGCHYRDPVSSPRPQSSGACLFRQARAYSARSMLIALSAIVWIANLHTVDGKGPRSCPGVPASLADSVEVTLVAVVPGIVLTLGLWAQGKHPD